MTTPLIRELVAGAITLAACSAPAKPAIEPTPTVGNLAPPGDTYCPPIPGLLAWNSEVFPACPPSPLGDDMHVCEAGACPKPCAMSSDVADNMGMGTSYSAWEYRYDDRGRWIETREADNPASKYVTTCAWDGERISRCTIVGDDAHAERDASGRLTRVVFTGEYGSTADITYGAHGEVLAVGDSTLRYDAGKLVGFTLGKSARRRAGEYTLERDARGNVVREIGPTEIRTYTYVDDGRRVREAISKKKPWALSSDKKPVDGPDVVSSAGHSWKDGDICFDCPADGPIEPAPDPETERAEMLEWIETHAIHHIVGYEGDRIVFVGYGENGPQRRDRHYSYECTK